MQPFILKPTGSLDENDFVEHPAWATFYEPDDIESLIELGFDAKVVRSAIATTGFSGSYSFALPKSASYEGFEHLYLSVRATTAGGRHLNGYVVNFCLGLFFEGKRFQFNPLLTEFAASAAAHLAIALGEENVFPVQLEIEATSRRLVFHFQESSIPPPWCTPL